MKAYFPLSKITMEQEAREWVFNALQARRSIVPTTQEVLAKIFLLVSEWNQNLLWGQGTN